MRTIESDVLSFLEKLDPPKRPTPPPSTGRPPSDPYIAKALADEIAQLEALTKGSRNDRLNIAAVSLGRLPIDRDILRNELIRASYSNGLVDDDGLASVENTIQSAFSYADLQGPRTMPQQQIEVKGYVAGHSGQLRMAMRLAESHHGKLLHVHDMGWLYWDGKRWATDDIGAAKRAVIDVLTDALGQALGDKELKDDVRKCESATGIAGVLSIASALPEFAATVRDLDADPYLLNVANGTVDLRTMELSPHKPADRLTKVTRAAYEPDADPGDWHRFLSTVLPDEDVRAYVQRQSGVALLGKVLEHVLPIWTGTGANGKSTAIGGLTWALGDYAMTAEPDLLLHREGAHPTGQMDLMGRRLAVITETDEGRKFAEATMKRLTGGDKIKARYMRQDFVEFDPSHTPILVTNHLPTVSGDDPAVWRRIRVVPFDVVIPEAERDGSLPERLQQCAEEVLTWCLAGWAEYQRIGLAEPNAVKARTNAYKADSDVIGRFITDQCVTGPLVKMTTAKLFEAWQTWRAIEGVAEISMRAFGQALDRHGYPTGAPSNGKRFREGIALATRE